MTIQKFLDCSTSHLTLDDCHKLEYFKDNSDSSIPRIISHQYGWWINVQDDDECFEDDLKALRKAGFSSSFLHVLQFAHDNECWWINFDQDAEEHKGLPTHEW